MAAINLKGNIRVIANPKLKPILLKHERKIHKLWAEIIASELNPYVPFDTGTMMRSVFPSGSATGANLTIVEQGEKQKIYLVWSTEYAARVFFGEDFNFTKTHHPQAMAYWTKMMTSARAGKILEVVAKKLSAEDSNV